MLLPMKDLLAAAKKGHFGIPAPGAGNEHALRACIDAFCAADFDGNGVDDTIGMAVDSSLWYASRGLFSGFGAYPQYWVEKNGDLEWGGVSEENKAALQFMAGLYADGRMDVEWVVSSKDRFQSVIDGKCGVFYGGFWTASRCEDCCDLDPNAKWVSVELPTLTGAPAMSPVKVHNYGWICINADCKNPEAVFKLAASTIYCYINADLAGFYADAGSAGGSPLMPSIRWFTRMKRVMRRSLQLLGKCIMTCIRRKSRPASAYTII